MTHLDLGQYGLRRRKEVSHLNKEHVFGHFDIRRQRGVGSSARQRSIKDI